MPNGGITTKKLSTAPISSLSSQPNETKVRIAGTIQELTVFPTKSNDDMAIVRVADETGSIEVFFFPNIYMQTAQLLTQGTMIMLQGRTFLDPGAEIKIVADKIQLE